MKIIIKNEFQKIKKGDWLIAKSKKYNDIYDIYINIKISNKKTEEFLCKFLPYANEKESIIENLKSIFQNLQHINYDFFILNKEEIKKYMPKLTLKELENGK